MTVELVKAIKEAESKAELIIKDAQQQARQAQNEAEIKAATILQEARSSAENKAKELLKKAEAEARAEAEPLVEEQQREITRLKKEAAALLPEAIAVLTDKVVKIDADY